MEAAFEQAETRGEASMASPGARVASMFGSVVCRLGGRKKARMEPYVWASWELCWLEAEFVIRVVPSERTCKHR